MVLIMGYVSSYANPYDEFNQLEPVIIIKEKIFGPIKAAIDTQMAKGTAAANAVIPKSNPTGVGTGGSGGGTVSSTGGTTQPTTTPGTPSVANAEKFLKEKFPQFKLGKDTKGLKFETGKAPSGSVLRADGKFYDSATGEVFEGQTGYNADGTYTIYLSDSTFRSDNIMKILLGHELVHLHNYEEHLDLLKSNPEQFRINTEYAAWTYSKNAFAAMGLANQSEFADRQSGLYKAGGAAANWTSNYSDIPLK